MNATWHVVVTMVEGAEPVDIQCSDNELCDLVVREINQEFGNEIIQSLGWHL